MHRTTESIRRDLAACLLVGAALSIAVPALAAPPAPRDKAALRLDGEALGKDYLETNFVKAEKKLEQALALCGKSGCSPRVLAQLHRDLGVVRVGGLSKLEAGKADFAAAVALDPAIGLDPDYATPAMKKILDELKGVKAEEPMAQPEGIVHTPVVEQAVATPIPLHATYKGGARLRVWYKTAGAARWTGVPMESRGSGYAAEIPCAAAAAQGDLAYFIEALGEGDETISKDGSRADPHTVHVRKELEGDPPHLPDADPPKRCKDACAGEDCASGGKAAGGARLNWFVLSIEQDLSIVDAGVSVCSEESQVNGGYSCFRQQGSQYHGTPLPGAIDNVGAGMALSTTRIHLGFDRVLAGGLTLGVRLGYVLHGGGPKADGATTNAFLPVHAEGRLAYYLGADVFSTPGFRPFLFAAGGAAQVDTHFVVGVREDTSRRPPAGQPDNPSRQLLDAYRRMGQGFAGGGAGLMYAFTPGSGVLLDVKYMRMFPTPGNVLAPELGFALGF